MSSSSIDSRKRPPDDAGDSDPPAQVRRLNSTDHVEASGSTELPATLEQGRIRNPSLKELEDVARNGGEKEALVATAVLDAIAAGTLKVGKDQHPAFAKYGGRLTLSDGSSGIAVVAVRAGHDQLTLCEIAFKHGGDAARTKIALQSRDTPPAEQKRLDDILSLMINWDRPTARATITMQLGTLPTDQHIAALNRLEARLAGKLQSEMPEIVASWEAGDKASGVTPQTRVEATRGRLDAALQDPQFRQEVDAISNLFVNRDRTALNLRATGVKCTTFNSTLYRRVMADAREPLLAIKAIRNHLEGYPDSASRAKALRDWEPVRK